MRKLIISILLIVFYSISGFGQTTTFTVGGQTIDVTVSNECDFAGAANGTITFTVISANGGSTDLNAIVGPVSKFSTVSINVGSSYTFNIDDGGSGLPDGNYRFYFDDGADIIDELAPGSGVFILELTPIDITSTATTTDNSSCSTPDGQIEVLIEGGSLAGVTPTGRISYTWDSDNGLAGLPLTISDIDAATDYTANLITDLNNNGFPLLTGLPGGQYQIEVFDEYSDCSGSLIGDASLLISDPSPDQYTVNNAGTIVTCAGDDITVELSDSQNGVTYEIWVEGADTGSSVLGDGSSPFNILVSSALFNDGEDITIRAVDGFCTPVFQNGTITADVNQFPDITPLADQVVCGSIVLPAIAGTNLTGGEAYYTGTGGTGTSYAAGATLNFADFGAYPVTLFIYDETGTIPNCSDEETFDLTIIATPDIDPLADQEVCGSFILPAITGTNLTGGEAYYTGTGGTGTSYAAGATLNFADFGAYPVTLFIYDETGTVPNCFDEETFDLTIYVTPDIDPLADQEGCDSFILPAITGTNLTGGEAYYTGTGGTGTSYAAGATLNFADFGAYPVTLFIYDETGTVPNCTDEETFDLTIYQTPVIDPLADQEGCDSFILPAITGTNLTGGEAYYTGTGGTGTSYAAGATLNFADFGAYPVTLFIYDETGSTPNCSDEETFDLTIFQTPIVDPLADQEGCGSFILPAITGTNLTGGEAYYTGTGGTGTSYAAGATLNFADFGAYPVTLFIYDETGSTPNCNDEESFDLTIYITPIIDPLADQEGCDSFILPAITGTNLTGGEAYYTGTGGTGTSYAAGATLNFTDFGAYPVTLFIYDETGGVPNCTDEETFDLTIYQTPVIDPLADQESCDSFVLPAITGTNLTGGEAYFTGTGGTGTSFAAGATINFADFGAYPVTLFIYDETGSTPNCSDEETFDLTINATPVIDPLADQESCDSFVLPAITGTNLTGGEAYYTGTGGTGTSYAAGATLNFADFGAYPVTLFIYDETGTVPNCSDEETFDLTIYQTPVIDPLADQEGCDSFILPAITGTNLTGGEAYYTGTGGTGTSYAAGATLNFADFGAYPVTLFIYDETGSTPNCSDEETFDLTIYQTPTIDPLADQESCDSFVLPAITGTNLTGGEAYYTGTGGTGTSYATGATLNFADFGAYPVTLFIYDETGSTPNCRDEETFDLTIYQTPIIDPLADQEGCDSFILPAITGTNLTGGEAYYTGTGGTGTSYAAGATLNFADFGAYPVTLFIYDETGTVPNCTDEETFDLTIYQTPAIDPLADQESCGSFVLPAITGTNLTGGEAYYTGTGGTGTSYAAGATLNFADFGAYPVTLFIYDETGSTPNCSDEETFDLTINQTPVIDPLSDQEGCDSFILPAITGTNLTGGESYYTGTGGTGTSYAAGATLNFADFGAYPVTLFIYDETGGVPNCTDEETFDLTIYQTPVIDPLADQEGCDSFILPAITGTNLTGGEAYYTGTGGTGTSYAAGATLNFADFGAYPVTLFIYDETGSTPNCSDEETFDLTIYQTPVIDPLADQESCDSFVLPAITGTNLTGGEAYYTGTGGTGTSFAAGATINFADFGAYPVTLFIYDETGSTPNCSDEETFDLTIYQTPVIDPLADQEGCDSFILPAITGTNLTGGEAYYTGTGGTGTSYAAGATLNFADFGAYPVTLFMYDETGTVPNCSDEETFDLTIYQTPVIDPLADQEGCDSFILPAITGTNLTGGEAYYTGTGGTGTSYAAGATLNFADFGAYPVTLFIYDETGSTPNCSDEETFDLTIYQTPTIDPLADQESCDSFILPAITGTNLTGGETYYTGTGGTGTSYAAGATLNFADFGAYPVTLFIYDETGSTPNCSDEETFDLTIYQGLTISETLNNPSTCGGTNGSIQLSGLDASTTYDVTYFDNGMQIDIVGNSNGAGLLIIGGLDASTYSDITIFDQITGCPSNTLSGPFTLSDPGAVTISVFDQGDPSSCGGNDGFIQLIGLNASTDYDLTYFDDGLQVDVTLTSTAGGEIDINGLDAGDYTTFSVTDTGSGCTSASIAGPVTLSDPGGETITLIDSNDPSNCGLSDGDITLDGLTASTLYDVDYTRNGVALNITGVTSDGIGQLVITGLNAASYNNFIVTGPNNCTSNEITTAEVLSDPGAVTISAINNDPTTCAGTDGSFIISGLDPSTSYTVSYNDGATLIVSVGEMSNGLGEIEITGLGAGSYTNIITQDLGTGCTSNSTSVDLFDPVPVTLAHDPLDDVNPSACGLSDGSITISGLANTTSYDVDYDFNSTPASTVTLVSDGSGLLTIPNLAAGNYSNIQVTESNCISTLSDLITLTDPGAVTLTVNTSNDPTTCSGTNGDIELSGLAISTLYNVTYLLDGAPVGPVAISSDGTGLLLISGLSAGDYTNIQVEESGCTSAPTTGTITLSDPTIPTFAIGTTSDPTTCGGSEGFIELTGLSISTLYDVSYDLDGVPVGPVSLSSDGTGILQISNLTAGDYDNFVVQDATTSCNSLPDATLVTLSDPAVPTLTLTQTTVPACDGSNLTLTAAAGYDTYEFRDGVGGTPFLPASATNTFTSNALVNGQTVEVFATSVACGNSTAQVDVVILPSTDPLCGGTGGTDCFAFTTNTNSITRPDCGDNNGAFELQITSNTNSGIQVIFNASTGLGTFSVASPQNTITINQTGLSAGLYNYEIRDGSGNICPSTDSFIELRTLTSVEAVLDSKEDITCFGDTGSATLTDLSPPLANYFYSIDGGVNWSILPANNTITGLSAGITTVRLGDSNGDPCPALIDVTIISTNPQINVTAEGTDLSSCDSNDGEVAVDFPPSGGANGASDPWTIAFKRSSSPVTDGDFGTFTEDVIFTNLTADSYTLYIRDMTECTYSEDFVIGTPGQINLSQLNTMNASCSTPDAGRITMRVDFVNSPPPPYVVTIVDANDPTNVVYTNNDGWDGDDVTGLFPRISENGLVSGDYSVIVSSETDGVCAFESDFSISGGPIPLSFDYELEQSCIASTREYINELVLTNIVGETGTDYTLFVFNDLQQVIDQVPITISIGNEIRITGRSFLGTPDRNFKLRLSQTQTVCTDPIIFDHPNTLEIPDLVNPLNVVVNNIISSLPEKSTGGFDINAVTGGVAPYIAILEGDAIGFGGLGPDEIEFNQFSGRFSAEYSELGVGNYDLFVSDALGCEIEIDIDIPRDSALFVPNIITPNNDGYNDYFIIRNLDLVTVDQGAELVITSRWGKAVYSNSNYSNDFPWGGEDTPEGLYFYKLEAGGRIYSGWIEVVKGNSP